MKENIYKVKITRENNDNLIDKNIKLDIPALNLSITGSSWSNLFVQTIGFLYDINPTRFEELLINNDNYKMAKQYRYTTFENYISYDQKDKYRKINDSLYAFNSYNKYLIVHRILELLKVLHPKLDEAYINLFKEREYLIPNDEDIVYEEGTSKTVLTNRYERDINARTKCLEHYGFSCQVCTLNFEKVFGSIGKNFIEVHHIKPLSEIKVNYQVDPKTDLIPVCPNCHSMLHRKLENGNNPTVDQLKIILEKYKINNCCI